jgi:PmbA protein
MSVEQRSLDRVNGLVEKALKSGADAADAIYVEGTSLSTACRKGEPEMLARSEGYDLGLRVFVGQRQAMVSSSDFSEDALDDLVSRAVAMAKVVPEDPFCGLAPTELLGGDAPDLDDCDPVEPSGDVLEKRAAEAEDAARSVAGITNSEGAEASWGHSFVALAGSNGFSATRAGSSHSVSVSVIAGEGTEMERDYDYAVCVHGEDLPGSTQLGLSAAEKAVKRLNPRKVDTSQVPVIFDPRVSNSMMRHFSGAINGVSVARGTTFLKDMMGKQIFSDGITVVDDPLRRRGLGSKAFDAEGVATQKRNFIEDGVLQSWVLDLRSSRQLGLQTTGNASRGTSSAPSPSTTNFYLAPGKVSQADLIGEIDNGFYVTELIGMGVNGVTGDYSRGASGFWIENGEITFAVSEMTIAGNLKDMFMNLTAADDLEFKFGTNAPTIRVDGLTVAGSST